MTLQRAIAVFVLPMFVVACDEGGDQGLVPDVEALEVPVFVQELIDEETAADGQIHVQRTGKIDITTETQICYDPDGFLVEAKVLFAALSQPTTVSGSSRLKPIVDGRCEVLPSTVFLAGITSQNRLNKSYKLSLAIWQNDATWVASVERREGHWHPDYQTDVVPTYNYGIPKAASSVPERLAQEIQVSRHLDILDLSDAFAAHLSAEGGN